MSVKRKYTIKIYFLLPPVREGFDGVDATIIVDNLEIEWKGVTEEELPLLNERLMEKISAQITIT